MRAVVATIFSTRITGATGTRARAWTAGVNLTFTKSLESHDATSSFAALANSLSLFTAATLCCRLSCTP